jgi:hypothetical protein
MAHALLRTTRQKTRTAFRAKRFPRPWPINIKTCFFCVGVMYSGEYDACDVTLSISTPGKLEKYA